ncbi:MAG: YybH family protein [Gammaproteobacteria bacterium]
MQDDEQEIRQLVSAWMDASKSGDVDKVLSLMTDDAVFLVTGQPIMHKADFAAVARAQAGADAPEFDGSSEIQEIKILGEWAFMWQRLTVSITPRDGAGSTERAGYTLTILQKQDGKWKLARDANMLARVEQNGDSGGSALAKAERPDRNDE